MTDVARDVQDHPDQMLYRLIGLAILLVITEIRYAIEPAALRRAFLRQPGRVARWAAWC